MLRLTLAMAGWLLFVSTAAADDSLPRYMGRLADGERIGGRELTGWDRPGGELQLDGRALLAQPALMWLQDRHCEPPRRERRPAFLEMWQGDVLPGKVVGFEAEQSLPSTPSHFVVTPGAELQPPPSATRRPVRVRSRWVRRIVLQPNPTAPQLQPSQVRLRDGRIVAVRALRLEADGVAALTETGRAVWRWNQLAEVRFPATGALAAGWQAQWEQRAVLAPAGKSRLLEVFTDDHLAVTSSLNRLAFAKNSPGPAADLWVHGLHPVWSLDALWVPSRRVWLRVSYLPHQMPLSRLEPASYEHRPLLGVRRPWRRDRSVLGQTLWTADGPAGWGLGVHSYSELKFVVPPMARRLTGAVGLDATAEQGGCVMAKVLVEGRPQFQSPPLTGAQSAAFDIPLPDAPAPPPAANRPPQRGAQITLVIDPLAADQPPGADPLDIRDQSNWFDVMLELEPEQVREACRRLAPTAVEPWRDWAFWSDGETQWKSDWDTLAPSPGAFVNRLESQHAVILAREIRRRPLQRYLVLSVSNVDTQEPAQIEVHSGGQVLLRSDVPERSPRSPATPILTASLESLPLDEPRDLVVVVHADEPMSLHWQALDIAESHPEFTRLFDDQPHEQAIDDRDQAYTGPRCYRVRPGQPLRHEFQPPMPFRYRPTPRQSRYLRFAVAAPAPSLLAVRLQVAGETQPRLYDLGQGPLTEGRARRIHTQPLSPDWLPISRDICGDLRDADVEWIEFFVPDGMAEVRLDQAYVGRGGGGAWNDLETPVEQPWREARERQLRAENLAPRTGAGVVALQFEDGRSCEGFVIDAQRVLTLGEAVPRDGEVRITAADGRQFSGKLLGVSRRHNWALIESTDEEKLPAPPPRADGAATIPFHEVMVECGVGGDPAAPLIAGPLPTHRLQSLAPSRLPPALLGRPLLTARGDIVGLRSELSRPRFVSLVNLAAMLNELKQPERRGEWLLGEGPQLGASLRWSEAGAVVTEVTAAARAAGLQPNDILLEVEGQPVREAWSAHQAVAERDPGDEVTLKLQRESTPPREIRLRLAR